MSVTTLVDVIVLDCIVSECCTLVSPSLPRSSIGRIRHTRIDRTRREQNGVIGSRFDRYTFGRLRSHDRQDIEGNAIPGT